MIKCHFSSQISTGEPNLVSQHSPKDQVQLENDLKIDGGNKKILAARLAFCHIEMIEGSITLGGSLKTQTSQKCTLDIVVPHIRSHLVMIFRKFLKSIFDQFWEKSLKIPLFYSFTPLLTLIHDPGDISISVPSLSKCSLTSLNIFLNSHDD